MLNAAECFLLDRVYKDSKMYNPKAQCCFTQAKKERERERQKEKDTHKDKEIKETHCPVECLRSCYSPFSFVKSSYTL